MVPLIFLLCIKQYSIPSLCWLEVVNIIYFSSFYSLIPIKSKFLTSLAVLQRRYIEYTSWGITLVCRHNVLQ